MSVFAFLLECGAAALLASLASSLIAMGASWAVRVGPTRLPAQLRADLLALISFFPAAAVLAILLAVALPSLSAAAFGTADHCGSHGHHLHLCILHAGHLRPLLASTGAVTLALASFRLGRCGHLLWRNHRRLLALEALGTRNPAFFPLIRIPGAPRLCHATGVFRRRILLSTRIEAVLDAGELAAALAHEHAHLVRRDPLVATLLRLAGCVMPSVLARSLFEQWQRSAEEACDAHAAAVVGDGSSVARALVKMAALQSGFASGLSAAAFGETSLERRVRLLLDGPVAVRLERGLVPALLACLLISAVSGAVLYTDPLHHAVETALHLFS